MFPSIKSILALDMMYTDRSMHSVRYKNPLELYIGTIKQFRNNSFTGMLLDVNLQDTNILPGLNWTPYFPGSVFGRD